MRRDGRGILTGLATVHLLLFVFCAFNCFNFCNGQLQQPTAADIAAIISRCLQCDNAFTGFWDLYNKNFTAISSSGSASLMDLGRLHCRNFEIVSRCYLECTGNFNYTYSSAISSYIGPLLDALCDPDCNLSYLSGCYAEQGRPMFDGFSLFFYGCNIQNGTMLASISTCIDQYASGQKCAGLCTNSQRALTFVKFSQEIICNVLNFTDMCKFRSASCFLQYYAPPGLDFISGVNLINNFSDSACRQGRTFSQCMNNMLVGSTPPGPPCLSNRDAILNAISLSDAIFQPFCDRPSLSYNEVCPPGSTAAGNSTGGSTKAPCTKRRR